MEPVDNLDLLGQQDHLVPLEAPVQRAQQVLLVQLELLETLVHQGPLEQQVPQEVLEVLEQLVRQVQPGALASLGLLAQLGTLELAVYPGEMVQLVEADQLEPRVLQVSNIFSSRNISQFLF